MELRSRSRSKTPLFLETIDSELGGQTIVTRTRRSATVKVSGEVSKTESYSSTVKSKKAQKSGSRGFLNVFKTSDYSSEEGEVEVKHISQNQKNQIIEDAKAAANGNSKVSALDLYRKAGRYWDKYPKTDWTYSPHSRDRVEIAPGIVQMPNMSRPTIHLHDSSTNTEAYWQSKYAAATHQQHYNSNNNYDDYDETDFIIKRRSSVIQKTVIERIKTTVYSVFYAVFWLLSSIYYVQNSTVLWIGKKLHHLTSRLMLIDTWLLKRSSREGSKLNRVALLCLVPLLLLAGWWLLSSVGSALYTALTAPSNNSNKLNPVLEEPINKFSNDLTTNNYELNTDELIKRLVETPEFHTTVNNYYQTHFVRDETDKSDNVGKTDNSDELLSIIEQLRGEVERVKSKLSLMERVHNTDLTRNLIKFRTEYLRNFLRLNEELKVCCRQKPIINIEPHLQNLLNDPDFLSKQSGLLAWLQTLFLARDLLEQRLSNITETYNQKLDLNQVEATADKVMGEVVAKLSSQIDLSAITEEKIQEIVRHSLLIYDADKTGLVDYAMEPMGGQVLTTRCTETYHARTAVVSILGIPIWYPNNTPRRVITPGINPGECWAFQNFPGFIVIKLANRIKVEAFSLEHVSRLLVPEGRIDSAPKSFEVYGLREENDKNPVLIGDYVYDYDGESIQYFAAQNPELVFDTIELRIKSNHGNPNYTCLYRFRVHGKPSGGGTAT